MVTLRNTKFKIKKLHVLVTVYLCVLEGSQKELLFPYTELTEQLS